MSDSTPQYLLFSEARSDENSAAWRFRLRSVDGQEVLEASDMESKARGERLELLAIVRGLEALDQPSSVTLVGTSRHVRNGLQYGLSEWRSNGWRWEFFGEMVPVKNADLWQRIDRALRFHTVQSRYHRVDSAHTKATPHAFDASKRRETSLVGVGCQRAEHAEGPGVYEKNAGWLRFKAWPAAPMGQWLGTLSSRWRRETGKVAHFFRSFHTRRREVVGVMNVDCNS